MKQNKTNNCKFDDKYKEILRGQNNVMYAFLYSFYTLLILGVATAIGFLFYYGIDWSNNIGEGLGIMLYIIFGGLTLLCVCYMWHVYNDEKRIKE